MRYMYQVISDRLLLGKLITGDKCRYQADHYYPAPTPAGVLAGWLAGWPMAGLMRLQINTPLLQIKMTGKSLGMSMTAGADRGPVVTATELTLS